MTNELGLSQTGVQAIRLRPCGTPADSENGPEEIKATVS
jgi:hypothetical protein